MELPSSKWMVSTGVSVAGAVVVVVAQLQSGGIELPSIVVTVSTVAAALGAYYKKEIRPPSSAVESVRRLAAMEL